METIKLNDINEKEIIANIKFRPKTEVIFALVFGIICIFIPHWAGKIVGVISLILAGVALIAVEDKKTISILKDYLIIYRDKETIKINYDEIDEWTIKSNPGASGIGFMLKDGDFVYVATFQYEKARQALNKVIREKESSEKKLNERHIERDTLFKKLKRKIKGQ